MPQTVKFFAFLSIALISMNEQKTLPSNTKNKVNRGLTSMNMQWLSERVKKAEKIKQLISANEYSIDSKSVVLAMLDLEH